MPWSRKKRLQGAFSVIPIVVEQDLVIPIEVEQDLVIPIVVEQDLVILIEVECNDTKVKDLPIISRVGSKYLDNQP